MSSEQNTLLDENARRYYLDAMGIQCWQTVESTVQSIEGNKDVVELDCSQLERTIQQCHQCELHQARKQALPGRGNQSAELMIVLLSPSASDDADNNICSGEANVLLSKMLMAIDIDVADVYITSLLKCYVPEEHAVLASEMQSCQHYLNQQIQLIQPKIIMLLGEMTARYLLKGMGLLKDMDLSQNKLSLDDYRAMNNDEQYEKLLYPIANIPLFVSYSPEELLQHAENKRKAWADLQLLKKIITAL